MAENRELALVLKLAADQFTAGLSSARESVKKFGLGVAEMAAPLAAVGVAMGAMVVKAANFGDQLAKAAQKAGTTVEELSRLQYAAKLADVSNEQLTTGLGKLSKGMFDASQGTGEARKAFDVLGIKITDGNGKLKSAGTVFTDIAGKFAAMQDGTEKTAVAMQIFGRAGADLIPLLNAGKEGLAASAEEANRFGVVLSTESAQAAEQFNDNLTRLKTLFDGVVVQLGAHFIPALNNMVDAILPVISAIGDWAKAHPQLMEGLLAMAGVLGSGGAVAVAVAAFGALLAGFAAVGGPILLWSAGISAVIGVLVGFRKEIGEALASVKQFITDGLGAADRFITTMIEGLNAKLGAVAKVAVSIANTVAKFLKPGSPTEAGPWNDLDKWGERFGETLAEGMERGAGGVSEAAKNIAAEAKAAFNQESAVHNRVTSELDIRGSVPTRADDGRYVGPVSRTGTTFQEGMAESFSKFAERAQDSFAQGVMVADTAARAMAQAFERFFFDVIDGKIRSLKDVFNSMLDLTKEFVSAVIKELIRIAAVKFIGMLFSSVTASEGGQVIKAAQGGQIVRRFSMGGPVLGMGNQDTVPALLTPGEYVLSRNDVADIKRGAAGGNTIVTNITINNASGGRQESSNGASPNFAQLARDLSKLVEAKLVDEQRPGGLLARGLA